MKNAMKYALMVSALFTITTGNFAQEAEEQRPVDMIEAKPQGGFSKSISGKWDCGDFGTMTLKDTKGKVTGKYTYKNGSVTGTVKNNVFKGTWKQAKGRTSGSFELAVSIERMTPEPTNLRGKWKNKGESDWQESAWECSK